MVDNRTMAILMELFATRKESLYELSIQTGIEKEQLHSNLELVNQLLQEHSFPQIQYKDSEFVISTELYNQKESVFSLFRSQSPDLSFARRKTASYLSLYLYPKRICIKRSLPRIIECEP
ncbi:transcriptional antiterminator [Streptococcus suis]|uniref:hypothetical protein n=1 Tax=Streptococcus suis TaxID=1307 RepID=UPI0007697A2D|nr:hypothetical protein [Streptococcus suis]CYY50239.1 transcriptional antiterminator [Streptococcus suis]